MTLLIILAVFLFLFLLALGALWLANELEHRRTEYRCNVTGTTVRPLGVGTPQTVADMRYVWFACPACDRTEKQRHEAGFDRKHPGVHLHCLDDLVIRPVWRSRWRKAV